jgi:hypothetical protein
LSERLARWICQILYKSASIELLKQGCSTEVGLRNTLEPDPDNTGVGSFRSHSALFLRICREFPFFMLHEGENYALL